MGRATLDALHVKNLVADLKSALQDPSVLDENGRISALETAKKLTDALETPQNVISQELLMPNGLACVRIAVDLDLFNALVEDPHRPKQASELAAKTGAEEALIVRIMRVLTANGFAKEVGEAKYSSTPTTVAMTNTAFIANTKQYFSMHIPSAVKLPDFFQKNGYKNPATNHQTPFQFAAGTEESYFGWMEQHPAIADNFHSYLTSRRKAGVVTSWMDWFPAEQQVLAGAKDDAAAVTIVDIGGGRGGDVLALREKHPHAPGRFVVQDLKHVSDSTTSPDNIERMAYDFFTPQPIKGARLYFMGSVLHNWDDENSLRILKNVAAAMTKGYSKLYLNELILPDVGCPLREANFDILMMMNTAGMERAQGHWKRLLHAAGFPDVKFWLCPDRGFNCGIVEASL